MSNFESDDYSLFDLNAADPQSVATARLATKRWETIVSIVVPVIGQRETTRLFERSIHLSNQVYPWLSGSSQGFQTSMNLNALERSTAQQCPEAATAGAGLVLTTFHGLISGAIGADLAQQLLPFSTIVLPRQDKVQT